MPFLLPLREKDFNETHHQLLLSEVQRGNLDILREMHTIYKCHWNSVRAPKTGDTVCHIAARMGYIDIVDFLMYHWDWSPNITNNMGKTPLHEAAQNCHHELVGHMINIGGNPNCIKQGDWTPLMLACTKDGMDAYNTIKHLMRIKNNGIRNVNKDGWTALHIAVRTGDEEIFNLMMHYFDAEDVRTLLTRNKRTLLHIACLHGNIDIAIQLLKMGANVHVKDSCGNTPLHDCVVAESSPLRLIKLLVSNNANVEAFNNAGMTILHLASAHANPNVIEYILKDLKFKPNIVNHLTGILPIHVAARAKRTDVMELLIKYGADKELLDNNGRSAEEYLKLP